MTLKDRINALKTKYEAITPKEIQDVMHRATEELEKSGLKDKAPKVGERSPGFALKDAEGALISLGSLLEHGPVVLSFFRGGW
ncbi:MAG: hypothetical protein P4L55_12140 [Syntrophobacteraceae bacterium]|nr:hypothetical protein [Syntrophobacteraceae bacterium]